MKGLHPVAAFAVIIMVVKKSGNDIVVERYLSDDKILDRLYISIPEATTLRDDLTRELGLEEEATRAKLHICDLVMAMDKWANEEDGVHPDAIDAYMEARAFIGQPLPHNPDENDEVTYKTVKPLAPLKPNLEIMYCDICPHPLWIHNPDGSCGCGMDCQNERNRRKEHVI